MPLILHLTTPTAWQAAQAAGIYRGDTLDTQGFIHCSTIYQIEGVATSFFRGQTGLILLCIETEKVQPKVVFEHPINPDTGEVEPGSQQFPHIYGPLNLDAVVQVVDFPPNPDGTFTLPKELQS
jgi:uncharacterized protein (DUF952 family)